MLSAVGASLLRALNRTLELTRGARVSGTVRLDGEDVYRGGGSVSDLRRRVLEISKL